MNHTKRICNAVDKTRRVRVTVKQPETRLVDVDLRGRERMISFDDSVEDKRLRDFRGDLRSPGH